MILVVWGKFPIGTGEKRKRVGRERRRRSRKTVIGSRYGIFRGIARLDAPGNIFEVEIYEVRTGNGRQGRSLPIHASIFIGFYL